MNKIANFNGYLTVITEDQEGKFNVSFPDFPGCFTCGDTFPEATKNAVEALSLWIESLELEKKEHINANSTTPYITFTKPVLS